MKANQKNKRKSLQLKKKARKISKIIFPTNNQNQVRCKTINNIGPIVQDQETSVTDDNKTERSEAKVRAQAILSNTIVNTLK